MVVCSKCRCGQQEHSDAVGEPGDKAYGDHFVRGVQGGGSFRRESLGRERRKRQQVGTSPIFLFSVLAACFFPIPPHCSLRLHHHPRERRAQSWCSRKSCHLHQWSAKRPLQPKLGLERAVCELDHRSDYF
jgi:hypothetical protein